MWLMTVTTGEAGGDEPAAAVQHIAVCKTFACLCMTSRHQLRQEARIDHILLVMICCAGQPLRQALIAACKPSTDSAALSLAGK